MKRGIKAALLGLSLAVMSASHTQAYLVLNITESGGNVVYNMSGNVNTAAATLFLPNVNVPSRAIFPGTGILMMGGPGNFDAYLVNVPWTPFGTGGSFFGQTSGHQIAFFGDPSIRVPTGYVSGDPLSATGTIFAASFASIGISPGTYVTTFSNGGVSDSFTVNAIPEPSVPFLGLTAGVAGLVVRRCRGR